MKTQELKEVRINELIEGDDFLISYWRGNHTISNWVEFVDWDLYYIYFRVSKKVAPNRDPEVFRKIPLKRLRALFIEEK